MSKPVKDEIFGSRRTRIGPMLTDSTLSVYKDLFFCTCLWRYNKDRNTRYILLNQVFDENEYEMNLEIRPFFNDYINLANILFEEESVNIFNLRSLQIQTFPSKDDAAMEILKMVSCLSGKLQSSTARTIESEEVSELSRFLRKDMYGRLGSTDIDFIIHNAANNTLIIMEEKLFTESNGGSIGFGQYLSFRELLRDGLNLSHKTINFFLLFLPDENEDNCYYYDFLNERNSDQRKPGSYDSKRREKRIIFRFSEMNHSNLRDFIETEIL
ncbi:MAG: hypothetical protein ACFFAO_15420 [Candidatus Hermodarchaeota archaeon]